MPADHYITDTDMTKVANAIRAKAGITEPLVFPEGMKNAIEGISKGEQSPFYYGMIFQFDKNRSEDRGAMTLSPTNINTDRKAIKIFSLDSSGKGYSDNDSLTNAHHITVLPAVGKIGRSYPIIGVKLDKELYDMVTDMLASNKSVQIESELVPGAGYSMGGRYTSIYRYNGVMYADIVNEGPNYMVAIDNSLVPKEFVRVPIGYVKASNQSINMVGIPVSIKS